MCVCIPIIHDDRDTLANSLPINLLPDSIPDAKVIAGVSPQPQALEEMPTKPLQLLRKREIDYVLDRILTTSV